MTKNFFFQACTVEQQATLESGEDPVINKQDTGRTKVLKLFGTAQRNLNSNVLAQMVNSEIVR